MRIQLSEHFTYGKLLRFTFPSIIMMIFTSIYSVVDGIFVSNFAGKTPFAAINLIMPLLIVTGAPGFMVGTGGSAIVAKTMGQGKPELAKRYFSFLVCAAAVGGAAVGWLGAVFARPIASALGAKGEILEYCVVYARIILAANPFFILQNVFQSFFVTAEKPKLGLYITMGAGLTNIVLDALLVGVLHWGVAGAAIATILSQAVGGLTPIVYFLRKNDSLLRLIRPRFDGGVLWRTCTNGSSELMTNVSISLVNMLYNFQLIRFAGEDGVAAYGVIMYVNFIFIGVFQGYAIGSAPIVGYHFGARNQDELKSLFSKSLVLLAWAAVVLTALAEGLAGLLAGIFVSYDPELMAMTCRGFRIYSTAFLMMGFNIFASAFFTALNDGLVSAFLSFLRTLVFQIAAVLILPVFLDLDGVWWSIAAAEGLALVVSGICFWKFREKYHYL